MYSFILIILTIISIGTFIFVSLLYLSIFNLDKKYFSIKRDFACITNVLIQVLLLLKEFEIS